MKYRFIAIAFLIGFALQSGYSQEEVQSLLGNRDIASSIYGQAEFGLSDFMGNKLLIAALEGGVMLNSKVGLGLNIKANFNNPRYGDLDEFGSEGIFRTVYGGFVITPVLYHASLVHLSTPVLVGGGMAGYLSTRKYTTITSDGDTRMRRRVIDSQGFFVVEPSIHGELNITQKLRFYLGASYRIVPGMEMIYTTDNEFNGITFKAGFIVGKR